MTQYRYRVTGPRGGQYLTTTKREAEELTRNGGSFVRIGSQPKRVKRIGGWTTVDSRGKLKVGYSRHRNPPLKPGDWFTDPTAPGHLKSRRRRVLKVEGSEIVYRGARGLESRVEMSEASPVTPDYSDLLGHPGLHAADGIKWRMETKGETFDEAARRMTSVRGYPTETLKIMRAYIVGGKGRKDKVRNPLDRRLAGVMRQYGPVVAFLTAEVVIPARAIPPYLEWGFRDERPHQYGEVWSSEKLHPVDQLRDDMESLDESDTSFEDKLSAFITKALEDGKWYSEDVSGMGGGALGSRDSDRLIPWVALQVQRVVKGKILPRQPPANRRRPEVPSPLEPLIRLHRKITDVRDWVAATTPRDLMKLTIGQALRRASLWHGKLKREAKVSAAKEAPGEVVYHFDDGWTVHKLITTAQLKAEGDTQGTCVGGYCHAVALGETEIYSLRDPEGRPRVTIQVTPPSGGQLGRVTQVKGKGNNRIKGKKMCQRVREFINSNGWGYKTYDMDGCPEPAFMHDHTTGRRT